VEPRRDGDPSVLVASSTKARSELGWAPVHTTLEPIIASALRWHEAQPF
jgi:UDP-glucose 4-epimerase